MSPQIPLALRFGPDQQRDSFHGSPSVLAAVVGMWHERARQPAPPGLPTMRPWQAHCAAVALDWLDNGSLWE